MSNFSELLAMPLPSKRNTVVTEAADDIATVSDKDIEKELEDKEKKDKSSKAEEGCTKEGCCSESDDDDDETNSITLDDLEDFNADDLSDEELEALDKELGGEAVDSIAGVDDLGEEELSPDEEVEADDMMSVAATSMLINDELNAEEKADFAANESEIRTAINEGFMTESDANELASECNMVKEAAYNQKMIIRLNAEAKKKQLYAVAVNVSAAAHNDPDYRRLRKVMHARKILRARLAKKYHSEAMKRMKIYFNRLRKSRSSVLKKIADKVSGKD